MRPTKETRLQEGYEITFKAKPIQESGGQSSYKKITCQEEVRTRYNNTHEFPQSVHGLIKVQPENETSIYGTGTVIGLDLVLTAAHNVWDNRKRRKYPNRSIQFYAGINGNKTPFGGAQVKEVYIPENFIETSSKDEPEDDYALLVLDRALGEETGYFGIDVVGKEEIMKKGELHLVGYPRKVEDPECQKLIELENFLQYGTKASLEDDIHFDDKTSNFIHYLMMTSGGQSGSGVFYHDTGSDEYFVLAVHVLGRDGSYKSATWITQERFQQIQQWVQFEKQRRMEEEERNYLNMTSLGLKGEDLENILIEIVDSDEKSRIKRLNLSKNYLSNHAIFIITSAKWHFLEEINLSGNKLKDAEVKQLAHNIRWKNLIKLDLSDNEINNKGAEAIANNKYWKKLIVLLLNKNKIGDGGAEFLGKNTSWNNLQTLDLSENEIGAEGAELLGKNTSWTNLQTLDLRDNKIGDKGAAFLSKNSTWASLLNFYK